MIADTVHPNLHGDDNGNNSSGEASGIETRNPGEPTAYSAAKKIWQAGAVGGGFRAHSLKLKSPVKTLLAT